MRKFLSMTALAAAVLMAGCGMMERDDDEAVQHAHQWQQVEHAVAVLQPTEGNQASGIVRFTQTGPRVRVQADIQGLQPNSAHGFHVHEYGDLSSPDGSAAGSHYNPGGHPHGLLNAQPRHAGDLGNLQADAQGRARLDMAFDTFTVAGLENPIIGRTVIVHERADTGAQPTGDAGGRIAQGVVGIAAPPR